MVLSAAKEKSSLPAAPGPMPGLPETRVWGSNLSGATCIGAWTRLSSTARPACGDRCDGTASASLVQRNYSSIMGRFLTPDPYLNGSAIANPQSWNRYGYALGD